MNNFEHGQRRWHAPPSFHDVLLLERTTESVHIVPEKEQHTHVNKSTVTTATSDPHQQWKVPVKWIQAPTKNNKKKSQVRNRFEVLRTTKNIPSAMSTMIQARQKRSQRNHIKAECKIKHTNVEQCQQDSMHVVMEMRSTCALLREQRCLGVQKKERSGG